MERAFESIVIPERASKPRSFGLTMTFEGMESGVLGLDSAKDFLETCGEYVDLIKSGWLISAIQPRSLVKKKNQLFQTYQVDVFPGGILLERALIQGVGRKCLKEARELGFTAIEVSDSVISLDQGEKIRWVKEGNDAGLKVIVEVGKKGGGSLRPASVVKQLRDYLDVGAYKVIVESEELEGLFPAKGGNTSQGLDALIQIVEEVGVEQVILECPYGKFFPEISDILWWFVDQFGMNVNLGNIEPKHILGVETIRRGLSFTKGFGYVPVPER
jgi:phosphosulfolactate synthase